MFSGQTDTGHTDDIYQYRSSSPCMLAFWVTSTEHIMSIVLTSLLNRSEGRRQAGGGHTSGQYVTRLGSVLDFSEIFDDERKNLDFKNYFIENIENLNTCSSDFILYTNDNT